MPKNYNNYFGLSVRKRAFMGKRRENVLKMGTRSVYANGFDLLLGRREV
jgi:hypothetical protein